MAKRHTPAPLLLIKDLEALKTIADPLRTQIMEVLEPQPLTINEIAERLGLSASRLYYHINLLEKHGFIQVTDTTLHGNIIEKQFGVVARDFDLDPELLRFASEADSDKQPFYSLMLNMLEATRADLARSLEAREFNRQQGAHMNPRRVLLQRAVRRIPENRAEEFMARLEALFTEFQEAPEGPKTKTPIYAMTLALYPSFYYHEELDMQPPVRKKRKSG